MRESLRDPLRLDHMKMAIDELLAADADNTWDTLSEKDLKYFGVVKLLEIIGEAAYKLTYEFKDAHPATPWKLIIGLRHVLVNGYYQINRKDVLKTIREDLPVLRTQIETYLSEYEER